MTGKLLVVSQRNTRKTPAMSCVIEMEDVLVAAYEAQLVYPEGPLPEGDLSHATVMVSTITYQSLEGVRDCLDQLRERGAKIVAYVFDGWGAKGFFYNRKRRLKGMMSARHRLSGLCDWLVVPFEWAREEFSARDQKQVLHLPLGVDTTRVNGMNAARPITLLAYGRQPGDLTALCSEVLNAPQSAHMMHHTDHFDVGRIHDFHAHRRHFWALARNSAIALAYDPRTTHAGRFGYSIVGQRWFECLAAGCVIVGRRPDTPEADQLLDWPDATLEAPADAQAALEFILDLAGDPARLAEIRERNVTETRARHDWRQRFETLFSQI